MHSSAPLCARLEDRALLHDVANRPIVAAYNEFAMFPIAVLAFFSLLSLLQGRPKRATTAFALTHA